MSLRKRYFHMFEANVVLYLWGSIFIEWDHFFIVSICFISTNDICIQDSILYCISIFSLFGVLGAYFQIISGRSSLFREVCCCLTRVDRCRFLVLGLRLRLFLLACLWLVRIGEGGGTVESCVFTLDWICWRLGFFPDCLEVGLIAWEFQ